MQLKEIGQHSCGQNSSFLQDLQLYQLNQNAKIGPRALGAAPNHKIRFVPPTSPSEKQITALVTSTFSPNESSLALRPSPDSNRLRHYKLHPSALNLLSPTAIIIGTDKTASATAKIG